MVDKVSNVAGFTNGIAVDMAAIDAIEETPEKVENLKQFQPDTRTGQHGTGPEAWWSTSYIRKKEMFSAGDAANMVIDNQSGRV